LAIVTNVGVGCGGRGSVGRANVIAGRFSVSDGSAPDDDALARLSLQAKTGGCVRQNHVVLAPVAGVKLPVAEMIQPDRNSHQAGSDGDKTNSSPGRAWHKP